MYASGVQPFLLAMTFFRNVTMFCLCLMVHMMFVHIRGRKSIFIISYVVQWGSMVQGGFLLAVYAYSEGSSRKDFSYSLI